MGSIATKVVALLFISIAVMVPFNANAASQANTQAGTPPVAEPNRAVAFYPQETGQGTFVTVEANAGESVEFSMVFGNAGDVEQRLVTYSTAALSAPNGGFLAAPRDHGTDTPTAWVKYPDTEMVFQPGEGVVLVGRVDIPEDALPGEYVTALSAQQSVPFAVAGSTTFDQIVRWSVPVLIIVPGERFPAFDLTGVTLERRGDTLVAEITIKNTGNVTARPQGNVRLLDASGSTIGVSNVELESVYTGTETVFYVAWQTNVTSSSFSIQADLGTDERAFEIEKEFSGVIATGDSAIASPVADPLIFSQAELIPATTDSPPSLLLFNGEISNNGEAIEDARVSIVTYKEGEEVDRYPILQAVTIEQGTTPVEARYSLPGGFTTGTYTFEVTIELGDMGTQTVLVTQPLEYELTVP